MALSKWLISFRIIFKGDSEAQRMVTYWNWENRSEMKMSRKKEERKKEKVLLLLFPSQLSFPFLSFLSFSQSFLFELINPPAASPSTRKALLSPIPNGSYSPSARAQPHLHWTATSAAARSLSIWLHEFFSRLPFILSNLALWHHWRWRKRKRKRQFRSKCKWKIQPSLIDCQFYCWSYWKLSFEFTGSVAHVVHWDAAWEWRGGGGGSHCEVR